MVLRSKSLVEGEFIPARFTCDGKDISPDLVWDEVPSDTKSFVLLVHDPDAPAKDWLHWLVINIPATTRAVAANSVPTGGRELPNDFKRVQWGGPCPPNGVHRYFFELFAINIPKIKAANLAEVKEWLGKHMLASATLIVKYQRQSQ